MRDEGLHVKVTSSKSPRITRISTDYLSFRNKIRENPCDTHESFPIHPPLPPPFLILSFVEGARGSTVCLGIQVPLNPKILRTMRDER